jgi:serine/threonine protein kinase
LPDPSPWTPDGVIADRFQIVRELGRGGMGAVYLVFDRELCREVALKRSDLDRVGDLDHEARFCREFRAAAAVADPGVPQVYHSGRTAEGVLWFTMEVVRGESLRALLDRGALDPLRALDVAIGLGRILAHAHERGVIHRDVKPPNVMLEPGERVRLLDFGVCTPLPRFLRHAEARRRTRAAERWHSGDAAFVGTYGYSDPATHDGSPPMVRSDIFSVAAIAYEMLTGRRLFDPDSCVFRTIDPAELPLAAAALGDDLRAAASRDPFDRPRSMADFVQRLEIVRNTAGRPATPPAPPRRARWLAAAAVGLGVGAATLVLDALLRPGVERSADLTCVGAADSRRAADLAEHGRPWPRAADAGAALAASGEPPRTGRPPTHGGAPFGPRPGTPEPDLQASERPGPATPTETRDVTPDLQASERPAETRGVTPEPDLRASERPGPAPTDASTAATARCRARSSATSVRTTAAATTRRTCCPAPTAATSTGCWCSSPARRSRRPSSAAPRGPTRCARPRRRTPASTRPTSSGRG